MDVGVLVSSTTKNVEYWATRPYLSSELSEKIRQSNFLIVPWENFREKEAVFPQFAEDLYQFLQERDAEGIEYEICIDENQFQSVSLHADVMFLGILLFTTTIWPIATNVMAEFFIRKIYKPENTNIEVEVVLQDPTGRAARITYKGPASEFSTVVGGRAAQIIREDNTIVDLDGDECLDIIPRPN